MAKTTLGLIEQFKTEIKNLENKINNLQRVSDKLIEAREITTLERVVKELEAINERNNNQSK